MMMILLPQKAVLVSVLLMGFVYQPNGPGKLLWAYKKFLTEHYYYYPNKVLTQS